jgi:hypothetical protein
MREFFDRMDSGAYDGQVLVVLTVLVVGLSLWARASNRRNRGAFFTAQNEALEVSRRLGPDDVVSQLKVLDALVAWQRWQHRSVPSWAEVGDYPSPEERLALTLLDSTPMQQPDV